MSEAPGELSLGRVLQFCRIWLRWIILMAILTGSLVLAVVFALPRKFSSHFTVFVTGMTNMAASAQVQMQLAALFGLSSGGTEYVRAILDSDEVLLNVVRKLDLPHSPELWFMSLESSRSDEKTLEVLRKQVKVKAPEPPLQGPVVLTVTTISPQLSYQVADEIFRLLSDRLEREMRSRSVFLEQQLKESKQALDDAEKALKQFAEHEQIPVALEEKGKEEFLAQVELKTQRVLAEVELKALKGRQNAPGDVRVQMTLKSEIAGLEAKIAQLDEVMATHGEDLKRLPRQTKRYFDLMREVKSREKIFEIYLEHAELARLYDIGKSETRPFRMLDRPYQPVEPVKRNGLLKTLAGTLFGAALALVWALLREALATARQEEKELPLPAFQVAVKKAKPDKEPQL
ncbi:MAG: Wzz/FepE/Etk N-terminal domain-containing protein [Vulcanimicrobiota bacterium]